MRGNTPIRNSTSATPRSVFRIICILGLALWGGVLSGQEGNYKFENFGNQSVLLSGNVTGSVADLGLVYYNPARLGLIENPSFTIGGKAYEWSTYKLDNILQTERDLSSSKFGSLPATIAGTFNLKFLPGHKFAYSILSRNQSDVRIKFNSGIVEPLPEDLPEVPEVSEVFTDLDFRDRVRDEWFGITWAYPFSQSFSVGVSLFGSIYEHNGNGDLLINAVREDGQVVTYTNRLNYTQKIYGARILAGAAWTVGDIDMGAKISLPQINIKKKASTVFQRSLSGISSQEDFLVAFDYGDLPGNRKTALEIAYGLGIPWNMHKIHLNLNWYSAVNSYDRILLPEEILANIEENPFKEQLKSVVNFGLGGEFYVSPSLNILGSFSTDFSAFEQSINLFDIINQSFEEDINLLSDLWHVALGVDLNRPWGHIVVGASFANSSNNIGTSPEIPEDDELIQPRNVTTNIAFERWRFVIGLEIPLILEKLKDLPIPIN